MFKKFKQSMLKCSFGRTGSINGDGERRDG